MAADGYSLEPYSSPRPPPLPARPARKADIDNAAKQACKTDRKADLLVETQYRSLDDVHPLSTGMSVPELRLFSPVKTDNDDDSSDSRDNRRSLERSDTPPSRPDSAASSFVFEFSDDEDSDDDTKPLLPNTDAAGNAAGSAKRIAPPLSPSQQLDSRPHYQRMYDQALQELQQLELVSVARPWRSALS